MKNDLYDVQGNFIRVMPPAHKNIPDSVILTITNDIAINYVPGGAPLMQFSFLPDLDNYVVGSDSGGYEFHKGCPIEFYMDGEKQDIPNVMEMNGGRYLYGHAESDHSVRLQGNREIWVKHTIDGVESEYFLQVSGKGPGDKWSCHWNFHVCLPAGHSDLVENSLGLLGTPDGDTTNDWMKLDGTTVEIPVRQFHQKSYEYCHEWCVSKEDSFMKFLDGTTYDDYACGVHEPKEPEELVISEETCDVGLDVIHAACDNAEPALVHPCMIDCCVGGCDEIDEILKEVVDVNLETLSDEPEDIIFEFAGEEERDGTDTCKCGVNDKTAKSFKCGNSIYVCPDVEWVCSVQGSKDSVYYSIDEEQCAHMQTLEIGDDCIGLTEPEVEPQGLSNRVCYEDDNDFGTKVDSARGCCSHCKDRIQPFPEEPEAAKTPPTDAPTPKPTEAPVLASPSCQKTEEIDVCIALDNSGSICTNLDLSPKQCLGCKEGGSSDQCQANGEADGTLCCGNYETLTTFASNYITKLDELYPEKTSFGVVKYATTAMEVVDDAAAHRAIHEITKGEWSQYTGGFTNTQDAIHKCIELLADSKFEKKSIVLLTDGTPTACQDENEKTIKVTDRSSDGYCSGESCPTCRKAKNYNEAHKVMQAAAVNAADLAAEQGMSLIPVIVTSVDDNRDKLEELARCPEGSETCSVESFKGLNVGSLDEIHDILKDLVVATACEEPEEPVEAATAEPEELVEEPETLAEAEEENEVSLGCISNDDPVNCPNGIQVLKEHGATPFPSKPAVKIIKQDTSTVTVKLYQEWSTEAVSSIFYEYMPDNFSSKCYEEQDVGCGKSVDEITIACAHLSPVAHLNVCVVDDGLSDEDNATVPKCCHEDPKIVPPEKPTVCYTLEISCDPESALCEQQAQRLLRGSK